MWDKLHRQKGNSPDHQLRSQNDVQWKRMLFYLDNQDVGLEAATIKRVRNSSLVQGFRAENVTGLKHHTEDTECIALVEERSIENEARAQALVDPMEERMPV